VSVSELATELHVSVKAIETHQMRMKEKLALHSAAELRQKAREWLAKSAVNRIREDLGIRIRRPVAFSAAFKSRVRREQRHGRTLRIQRGRIRPGLSKMAQSPSL
jgi:hypothetical protein